MGMSSRSLLLIGVTAAICNPVFSQDDSIAAIESRVSLGTAVVGEPEKTASLKERMQQLNVPAVSIAVVSNGQLEWARAYGYADTDERTLATPNTLFQATAISSAVSVLGAMSSSRTVASNWIET